MTEMTLIMFELFFIFYLKFLSFDLIQIYTYILIITQKENIFYLSYTNILFHSNLKMNLNTESSTL